MSTLLTLITSARPMRLLVLAMLTGLVLGGTAQAEPDPLYLQLDQAVAEQDWEEAVDLIDQILKSAPERSEELSSYRQQLVNLQASQNTTTAQDSPSGSSSSGSNAQRQRILSSGSFPRQLAQHLQTVDATFYGASWCGYCREQKTLFGDAAADLPYVECASRGRSQAAVCTQAGVQAYPTWIINGKVYRGLQSLEQLAEWSEFPGI